jgi:hypothetical protein
MLIAADRSMLMVCDLQAKLLPALAEGDATVEHCGWLMDIASRLAGMIPRPPWGVCASIPEVAVAPLAHFIHSSALSGFVVAEP